MCVMVVSVVCFTMIHETRLSVDNHFSPRWDIPIWGVANPRAMFHAMCCWSRPKMRKPMDLALANWWREVLWPWVYRYV